MRENIDHNKPGTSHNGFYVKQLEVDLKYHNRPSKPLYPRPAGSNFLIRGYKAHPFELSLRHKDAVERISLEARQRQDGSGVVAWWLSMTSS